MSVRTIRQARADKRARLVAQIDELQALDAEAGAEAVQAIDEIHRRQDAASRARRRNPNPIDMRLPRGDRDDTLEETT